MYEVAIAPCKEYSPAACRAALEAALDPIGGLDFVKPGMKIAIKANLVSFMKPEAAATTHPELLVQLVKLLSERGATAVIGDSPGGLYNSAYVGRRSLDMVVPELPLYPLFNLPVKCVIHFLCHLLTSSFGETRCACFFLSAFAHKPQGLAFGL